MTDRKHEGAFDFAALLHPAAAFADPAQVVNDPDLTLNEKRAILASWASDACAIEAAPELRQGLAGSAARFDDVMDALRALDKQVGEVDAARYRRAVRRQAMLRRGRGGAGTDQGPSLN